MTREERALKNLKQMCSDGRYLGSGSYVPLEVLEDFDLAIKALEQKPFINKPCISSGVCEHDKNKVLDKIKAEIEQLRLHKAQFLTNDNKVCIDSQEVLNILDRYKAESEEP